MTEARQIRDPVFGFIPLNRKEANLVSLPIFQRLRRIRQLAFAYLVYPGALHTRFDHSLGVCHISGLLVESLGISDEDRDLLRVAALVHDLGHGPFSHVSEEALELYTDRDKVDHPLDEREKIHELLTTDVINSSHELKRLIGESDCERISKLLRQGYGEPLLRSLISGPLDADKQDYLLRDSYFCGVKYGVFDIHQLHRELRSVEDPTDGKQLMISPEGIHALEQFVLAKYYLTTQVYKHRVRLITDQMLVRAIILGIDKDEIDEIHRLYSYDGSESFLKNYISWDDTRFINTFTGDDYRGKYCHVLLSRLQDRRLLKQVYEKRINELSEECRDPLSHISNPENSSRRRDLEKLLHETICRIIVDEQCGEITSDMDASNLVIIHAYTIKSVRIQSRNDEGPILVDRRPTPRPFEEESALFRSIDESLNEPFVEVYAPVIYDSPTERRLLLNSLDGPITETIQSFFGGGEDDADT